MRPCAGRASAGPGLWSGRKPGTAGRAGLPPSGLDRRTHGPGRSGQPERSAAQPWTPRGMPLARPWPTTAWTACSANAYSPSCLTLWTRCGCRRDLATRRRVAAERSFPTWRHAGGGGASLAPRNRLSQPGARSRAFWEGLLVRAGFVPRCFEDHSRALVEMAARLLWYGADAAPEWLRGGCSLRR